VLGAQTPPQQAKTGGLLGTLDWPECPLEVVKLRKEVEKMEK
jgi:hypothetical protein